MLLLCYIQYIYTVSALICHIETKTHPLITSFTVRYSLADLCLVSGGGYTLVNKHVYRVYSAVLGLQFACTCNQNLVCAFLTSTCALCTRLVHT